MALLKRILKHRKMKKETAKKKEYLKHYKKAGRQAMTYAEWLKKGKQPTYFRGLPKRKTAEARMREAGMTLKRKKR